MLHSQYSGGSAGAQAEDAALEDCAAVPGLWALGYFFRSEVPVTACSHSFPLGKTVVVQVCKFYE